MRARAFVIGLLGLAILAGAAIAAHIQSGADSLHARRYGLLDSG